MLLVFVGLAVTTIANDIWNDLKSQGSWLDPETVRIGMIVFAAGFAVYVLEKEHHLKRLSFLGRRAQELDLVLAERILMSAVVAEATETVTTSIDLEQVLAQILHEADRLVGASLASIALLTDGGHLEEAWTRGASVDRRATPRRRVGAAAGRGRARAAPARRSAAVRADGPDRRVRRGWRRWRSSRSCGTTRCSGC